MGERTKRLLIGSGVLAAGVSAASLMTTKYMVDVALSRQEPVAANRLLKNQLQRFAGDEQFLQQLEQQGQVLLHAPHETVSITAADGEKLVGHWFACKDAKRVIVAMHGWRSSWNRDFGTIAAFWRKNGCSVLYPEQRGQGLSGGQYMGFGMMERHDCLAWAHWVNRRCGEQIPVYLAGVSMGASTVLMASELDLPGNVRGILADCGFTSADDIWRHVARNNLHISYRVRGNIADSLCKKRIHIGAKDCSTIQALKNCRLPVLFAHGTEDHFVPVEMTYRNYGACSAPKRLLIVPGADHGMSYYMEKDRYEQMTLEFFRDFDGTGQPADLPQ